MVACQHALLGKVMLNEDGVVALILLCVKIMLRKCTVFGQQKIMPVQVMI